MDAGRQAKLREQARAAAMDALKGQRAVANDWDRERDTRAAAKILREIADELDRQADGRRDPGYF